MSNGVQTNPDRRHVLAGAAACALLAANVQVTSASERPASPWSRGLHSRMRLSAAGRASATGPLIAVVEIGLDRGFKTYWRNPGDSGIPPTFNFAGSENVRDVEVHFPAPHRFDDGAGGHSIGYKGSLIELPVTFHAVNPAKPTRLLLKLDYAVCEKICVPASGQAELTLAPGAAPSAATARLLATLPSKQPLGAPQPLSLLKVMKGPEAEHFLVEVALPQDADGNLFVEAASPWIFDVKAPHRTAPTAARFTVLAAERDRTPDCKGVEIRMTLVSGDRAVETTTWLDVSLLAP